MKKSFLVTAIVAVAISFSAMAETVNLEKSSFTWTGAKVTGDSHTGTVKLKKAEIGDGKGEFIVDLTTFDVTDLDGEWKTKFLNHIKGDDFLKVDQFPTATLKINKIENDKLHGQLTIRGKTQDVVVPYKKEGNTYTGELVFDRTKFDIIYGSDNFFKNLGDKVIKDDVSLKFSVVTK